MKVIAALLCPCLIALGGALQAQSSEKEKPKDKAKEKAAEQEKEKKPGATEAEMTAIARLKEAFASYDKNKDGVVVREEFPGSDEQFVGVDTNKDKKVTEAEFTASPLARRFMARNDADAQPPRERYVPPAEREVMRTSTWMRFDKNKDGKVSKEEWTGAAEAFAMLDKNADGVLDRRDVAAEPAKEGPKLEGPAFAAGAKEIMERHDRNKDGKVTREEAGAGKVSRLFEAIDRDKNGEITESELDAAVNELARRSDDKDRGAEKRTRYEFTFDAWDLDKDGKLTVDEYKGPRELFPAIDRNRDAVLSRVEVDTFMRESNEVEFIKKYDANGDGRVSREEFPGTDEVFRRADKNGDGVVTAGDR